MRADKIGVATATFLALLIAAALPLSAGPLNGNPNALPGWSGTTPYTDGGSLTGTVDWAVFSAGGFAASGLTGLGGWTTNPGEFVYAYQVINTGAAPVSSFAVTVVNTASNAGAINGILGGTVPSTASVSVPGSATYTFTPALAGTTSGLSYNSPFAPMNFLGSVVDTGSSAFVIPLPSPSPNIPEPGSATLLIVGLFGFVWLRLRRR